MQYLKPEHTCAHHTDAHSSKIIHIDRSNTHTCKPPKTLQHAKSKKMQHLNTHLLRTKQTSFVFQVLRILHQGTDAYSLMNKQTHTHSSHVPWKVMSGNSVEIHLTCAKGSTLFAQILFTGSPWWPVKSFRYPKIIRLQEGRQKWKWKPCVLISPCPLW